MSRYQHPNRVALFKVQNTFPFQPIAPFSPFLRRIRRFSEPPCSFLWCRALSPSPDICENPQLECPPRVPSRADGERGLRRGAGFEALEVWATRTGTPRVVSHLVAPDVHRAATVGSLGTNPESSLPQMKHVSSSFKKLYWQ